MSEEWERYVGNVLLGHITAWDVNLRNVRAQKRAELKPFVRLMMYAAKAVRARAQTLSHYHKNSQTKQIITFFYKRIRSIKQGLSFMD